MQAKRQAARNDQIGLYFSSLVHLSIAAMPLIQNHRPIYMTQPDKLPDSNSEESNENETVRKEIAGDETASENTANPPSDSGESSPVADPSPESDDTETPISRVPSEQLEYSLALAKAAVKAAAENRGQNIVVLDLSDHTSLFDYFLIVSGSSRRQLGAMCSEIERVLKTDFNERKISLSGFDESRWIVLDYGSIVIHLFDEETREFYDLESLWGDGKPVDINAIVAQASAQMARFSE
jgi:ribosome-associated protein